MPISTYIHFLFFFFFFFNDTATTEIYTLSLHDALPISHGSAGLGLAITRWIADAHRGSIEDRKSTRLNSSHVEISYAVFCLKKKKKNTKKQTIKKQKHQKHKETRLVSKTNEMHSHCL